MSATMRFCRECNNILAPMEKPSEEKLYYTCMRCTYEEVADTHCVYTNDLVQDTSTKLEIVQSEVVDDPTLQRSSNTVCEKCNYSETVFFQAEGSAKANTLSLVHVCTHCGHKWLS